MSKKDIFILFLKVFIVLTSFRVLDYELSCYSNTISSFGHAFFYSSGSSFSAIDKTANIVLIIVSSLFIIYNNRTWNIVLFVVLWLVVLIFYPSLDMTGVNNPF
jgi:hypothetical protein